MVITVYALNAQFMFSEFKNYTLAMLPYML